MAFMMSMADIEKARSIAERYQLFMYYGCARSRFFEQDLKPEKLNF